MLLSGKYVKSIKLFPGVPSPTAAVEDMSVLQTPAACFIINVFFYVLFHLNVFVSFCIVNVT